MTTQDQSRAFKLRSERLNLIGCVCILSGCDLGQVCSTRFSRGALMENDFDRPTFFFELRDRYVCNCCELHGSDVILVPKHSRADTPGMSIIQAMPRSSSESRASP